MLLSSDSAIDIKELLKNYTTKNDIFNVAIEFDYVEPEENE